MEIMIQLTVAFVIHLFHIVGFSAFGSDVVDGPDGHRDIGSFGKIDVGTLSNAMRYARQ